MANEKKESVDTWPLTPQSQVSAGTARATHEKRPPLLKKDVLRYSDTRFVVELNVTGTLLEQKHVQDDYRVHCSSL